MGRKLVVDEDELRSILEEWVSRDDAEIIIKRAELADVSEKLQKKIERIESILLRL